MLDWAERTYARPTPRIGDWNWAEDGSNSTLPSHPNFLLERFSGNPDPVCGLADAKHNLAHPCMKYLMLPRPGNGDASLEEQLNRLASTLGPWINHTITHALQFQGHMTWKNVNTGKTTRTRDQSKDLEVAEKLREIIAADIELYEWCEVRHHRHLPCFLADVVWACVCVAGRKQTTRSSGRRLTHSATRGPPTPALGALRNLWNTGMNGLGFCGQARRSM